MATFTLNVSEIVLECHLPWKVSTPFVLCECLLNEVLKQLKGKDFLVLFAKMTE